MIAIISFSLFFLTSVISSGETLQGYRISQYDVTVNILKDGSLDITEKVKYSFLGNSNNAVLIIDKQKDEEIEIKNVFTQVKDQLVECERLSAGQWDANVFTGTYSEIQESNLVRLKIYGIFKKQQATILVKYNVKNAIKRYGDIAMYNRNHIQKYWNGYISNLSIEIKLPGYIAKEKIKPFLHGVLVGQKSVLERSVIKYNIPNTVPGEYVEARIIFPENLVNKTPRISKDKYLETVLQEEKEYYESDKTELLKARENAAKEAGRRAWNEKLKRRTQIYSMVIALFASFLGLLTIYRTKIALQENHEHESFELDDIPSISPPEACLILRGRTGARGVLSGLFYLASKGFIGVHIINNDICFRLKENCDTSLLNGSELHLLNLVGSLSDEQGRLCPNNLSHSLKNRDLSRRVKECYNTWKSSIRREYSERNPLNVEQLYYRNLGLIMGVILFAAGCIVPVAVSIWSGYLMLPVGYFLFMYEMNVDKKTVYITVRKKALKNLNKLFFSEGKNIGTIPKWMSDLELVLGFSIALRAENRLHLLGEISQDKSDSLSKILKDEDGGTLEKILEKALIATDNLLSDVLAN